jgi:hypothetical protein
LRRRTDDFATRERIDELDRVFQATPVCAAIKGLPRSAGGNGAPLSSVRDAKSRLERLSWRISGILLLWITEF